MIRVRFIGADGSVREAKGVEGARLLDVAQADGQPLEGTCDGDMACATCHVIVAVEDADRLPPPREEEEDLLDMVPQATRTSRLACQIRLSAALEGLTVRVPG
ncbi:2Fe-2S ferredoxin [Arthrobacter sp. TPD3018]|uniref:2Fe-2S iron-sulfur cluster-binding protein n=1 Tax=Bacteria TaxID=2 RepID=UPI000D50A3C8|nr:MULTISPECIES: 2Fe-2S iron-sulfur cluster-binding protein [Bacteria]PVE53412.1 2Fe-2S ferredoxin [Sphingomonas sp. TPD3009]PVE56150.1 2Fe-2S ferredoxin [Arthrobacter sp. TPD3018]PVE81749.1 2Fe-2S ferredoxin [Sphingomonas melonis]